VPGALGALQGAPWGAPEWNIFSGTPAQWAGALAGTLSAGNNRLLVVQNFESIAGDGVELAAVRDAVAAGAPCLVDAPVLSPAPARVNASAWEVAWALSSGSGSGSVEGLQLRASSLTATLPSGELAVADLAALALPGGARSALLALAPGAPPPVRVYWSVTALGCSGSQRMASDAGVIEVL
jgi:hypothetical protein